MKYLRIMITTIGLFAIAGPMNAARAQNSTLYTGGAHGGHFGCNAVNVSLKPLNITVSIIDPSGNPLSISAFPQTPPGNEVSGDFGDPAVGIDAYCKVQVSGTGDRNDLRVILTTTLIRTFDEGNQTNIPALVFREFEGH